MSTVTWSRSDVGIAIESEVSEESKHVSVSLQPRDGHAHEDAWMSVNAALRNSLQRAGFRQPEEVIEKERGVPDRWVIVAPGVMMREGEYEERFASIDLASLQQRMAPDLFVAFVRHLGTVSGREDLDVEQVSQIPHLR